MNWSVLIVEKGSKSDPTSAFNGLWMVGSQGIVVQWNAWCEHTGSFIRKGYSIKLCLGLQTLGCKRTQYTYDVRQRMSVILRFPKNAHEYECGLVR